MPSSDHRCRRTDCLGRSVHTLRRPTAPERAQCPGSRVAIAALTEQAQREISEILHGNREVQVYDVLVRIAVGLGIPPRLDGPRLRRGDRSVVEPEPHDDDPAINLNPARVSPGADKLLRRNR